MAAAEASGLYSLLKQDAQALVPARAELQAKGIAVSSIRHLNHGLMLVRPRPKTFVCHASEDASVAADVANRLLGNGFPVWLDRLCILPGQDWEQSITEGVDSSHAIVVLVSKNSVDKTGFLQSEIRLALLQARRRPEGAVFILPVLVDGTPPPSSFDRWQWVRMDDNGWFEDIKSSLLFHARYPTVPKLDDVPEESVLLTRFKGGNDGTVDFVIDLRKGDAVTVGLGVSVISANGSEIFDPRLDVTVALRSGVAAYRRQIPAPRTVGDRIVGAVWRPKVPQGPADESTCESRSEYTLSAL
jgi:hypothetical protein